MGLDKCIITRTYHYDITQSIFIALKAVCALPAHPFLLPPTPGNHWSFSCLHSFAFSRRSCSWSHTVCSVFRLVSSWCKELTHWKRPWCWERLKMGGEGDNREWNGWMASLTQWTWVWVSSGSWWRTGKPGVPQSTGSQRARHNWSTELTVKCV